MENEKDSSRTGKTTDKLRKRLKILTAARKMDSGKRQLAIYLVSALLVASLAGLLWSYTASANREEEFTTFYFLQEASFDYRVHTLPNNIFESRVLGSGNAYITSLTDRIVVDFNYHFLGESEAELTGSYSVTGTLAAYTAQEEHLVWDKVYVLLPQEHFSASSGEYNFNEQFDIPFADYLAFTEQVREETGFNPSELNLVVWGNVSVEAETADGVVAENLAPTMIIPMKGSTFTVGGELLAEKEGGITQTRIVPAAPVTTGRAVTPIIFTVAVMALVVIRFLTVPAETRQKPKLHETTGILKKHKERIVITANGVTEIPRGAITVYSFDELLKLADEVAKPILYPRPGDSENSNHFFLVYTPEQVYAYGVYNKKAVDGVK